MHGRRRVRGRDAGLGGAAAAPNPLWDDAREGDETRALLERHARDGALRKAARGMADPRSPVGASDHRGLAVDLDLLRGSGADEPK